MTAADPSGGGDTSDRCFQSCCCCSRSDIHKKVKAESGTAARGRRCILACQPPSLVLLVKISQQAFGAAQLPPIQSVAYNNYPPCASLLLVPRSGGRRISAAPHLKLNESLSKRCRRTLPYPQVYHLLQDPLPPATHLAHAHTPSERSRACEENKTRV